MAQKIAIEKTQAQRKVDQSLRSDANFDGRNWNDEEPLSLTYRQFLLIRHKITFINHFYFWSNFQYWLSYGQTQEEDFPVNTKK